MTTASSPVLITLTDRDRAELESLARARKAPLRSVQRASIILAAAGGGTNAQIARDLGVCIDTVRTWRGRFAAEAMKGLADRPRSGRPPMFAATVVAGVKALACALPAEQGLPLSRWSAQELADEAVARGITDTVSGSTVRLWLNADAIKPWRHRSWIFPRDPDFAAKAERVLDLYDRRWEGRRLRPDEYVISADEKSQLQALRRRHDDLPPAPERTRRVEFEYTRGLPRRVGRPPRHGDRPLRPDHRDRPVQRAGRTGHDPGALRLGTARVLGGRQRLLPRRAGLGRSDASGLANRCARALSGPRILWLNQIEIYFSIVQRKVIKPANFADLPTLEQRLLAFENRYNATASPFNWRYTKADLNDYLA